MKTEELGASPVTDGRCQFRVWAPNASRVEVHLLAPEDRLAPLEPEPRGYHAGVVDRAPVGSRYRYRLDGNTEYPDPASRLQPEGVHGSSAVVSREFEWSDGAWCGRPLEDYIIYELHVGTFTSEGTFDQATSRLDQLCELGVTAVELMPVAQFPGERNWGYDGVYPFAVQASYGGPAALARFIDACHARELAVVLDVVYNHLGPEGNYLGHFAPYFTERYRTPWGQALNFDGPDSDEVRRYFIDNALYWIRELHVDALRLDAVHAILDASPYTFLEELADAVRARAGRRAYLIPESAANDVRLIRARELGGFGHDAQWNDDFHHALRVLLTGERRGYYQDYTSGLEQIERAFREGYVYAGEYSPFRRRRHGTSSIGIPAERFVVFSQNHDQVGNRMRGDRLSEKASFEHVKLAAAAVVLSPFLPLVFMGEEYGETAPFPYFVSHSDPELIEAVREGRREEFAAFDWSGEPPDPQSEETFASARLRPDVGSDEPHRTLYGLYRELIALRKQEPALRPSAKRSVHRFERERVLVVERSAVDRSARLVLLLHFGDGAVKVPLAEGAWRKVLDSADARFRGPGSAVPERVDSNGSIELELAPWSAVVLAGVEP
jgi:maltooligosyltrehalose trehalohydrolase